MYRQKEEEEEEDEEEKEEEQDQEEEMGHTDRKLASQSKTLTPNCSPNSNTYQVK